MRRFAEDPLKKSDGGNGVHRFRETYSRNRQRVRTARLRLFFLLFHLFSLLGQERPKGGGIERAKGGIVYGIAEVIYLGRGERVRSELPARREFDGGRGRTGFKEGQIVAGPLRSSFYT